MSNKKLKFKNLIKIILGIIVLVFLLLVCFKNMGNTNKVGKYINDMELLEEKVNTINEEYLLWENYDPNEAGNFSSYIQTKNYLNASSASNLYIDDFEKIINELNVDALSNWDSNLDQILSNYCYFTPSLVKQNFGIENQDYYLIINFYTGNIINKNGINYNGKTYYRHYDLEENLGITTYQNNIVPNIEIVENNGLNKKIKISLSNEDNKNNVPNIAEIYYLTDENDENKKRCTEIADYQYISNEKAAYFTIHSTGRYEFIVEDTNYIQYPKVSMDITLCNRPVLEDNVQGIYFDQNKNEVMIKSISDENWYNYSQDDFRPAYSKKEDGSYWVWVPRFIYRELGNEIRVIFVYNTSQTSTTNKQIINYNLPKVFEGELPGIWIKEENIDFSNINYTEFFKKVLTNGEK